MTKYTDMRVLKKNSLVLNANIYYLFYKTSLKDKYKYEMI